MQDGAVGCVGLEHEIDAGIVAASEAETAYCMCFVRHIEGLRYHLQDRLAPNYIDVIEVNHTRTIERARVNRLAQIKVITATRRRFLS